MRIIIFGAGNFCKKFIQDYANNDQIIAIADNNTTDDFKYGHKVIKPTEIANFEYDRILICIDDYIVSTANAVENIYNQLFSLGVDKAKIMLQNFKSVEGVNDKPRTQFLEFAAEQLKEVKGDVAECGVFKGHFAGVLNKNFSDRKLYLFDTFSGFDEKDIKEEINPETDVWLNDMGCKEQYSNGSEILAFLRCPNKENVIINKGYVPETLKAVENEKFCFVNLDMDLYLPTIAALNFFYERLEPNGIILLHDYYNPMLLGVKDALSEFIESNPNFLLSTFPIGDSLSIGLIKIK